MRKKRIPIPEECIGMEIRVHKSNCTGEATVGFYDPKSRSLKHAEFAANEKEIKVFYEKYGKEDEYGRGN